jgi:hypothetical protein
MTEQTSRVTVGSWFRTVIGTVSGQAQFFILVLTGSVGDRVPWIYELDARISSRRLRANLRRQDAADCQDRRRLRWSEHSKWSQNGEDGVIEEILARIGVTDHYFVEIGASDGEENCTRNLVEAGWRGVWVEADPRMAEAAAAIAPSVEVIGQPVSRHDVADVLARRGVPPAFDLLVVDIDGDDLGVLRSCLRTLRPRVVVVEYNAVFSPTAVWSKGESAGNWDGTFRHGASLGALQNVACRSGYVLVHCDRRGVNAFFVRRDLADDQFPQPGRVRAHYRVSGHTAHPFGNPRSRRALSEMAPMEVDQVRDVDVEHFELLKRDRHLPGFVEVAVTVTNRTSRWLMSGEPNAIHLSLRELAPGRGRDEYPRTKLPRPIAPFASARVRLWYRVRSDGQPHRLRVTIICEWVAWREDLGGPGAYADLDL